jgi:hypothetical protein
MTGVVGRKSVPDVLKEIPIRLQNDKELFFALDKFGGFPEPFLKQNTRVLRRWHSEKVDRLFREDICDIEQVRDIVNMQLSFQVVKSNGIDRFMNGVRIVSANRFLAGLI